VPTKSPISIRRGRFSGGSFISATVAVVPSATEVSGRRVEDTTRPTEFHAEATASTKIESANSSLIPSRALQTWQMRFEFRASNLICCSSQMPSSRNRAVTSGAAESCLMQTTVPASTRLNGQTPEPTHCPSKTTYCFRGFFTVVRILNQLRLSCNKELVGFLQPNTLRDGAQQVFGGCVPPPNPDFGLFPLTIQVITLTCQKLFCKVASSHADSYPISGRRY